MRSFEEERVFEGSEKAAEGSKSKVDAGVPPPDVVIDIKGGEDEKRQTISFFTLFRFATRLEICLNILALVAAAGAGTAQPLLALVFGNLTQTFVNFGSAVIQLQLDPTSQSAQEAVEDAARKFRSATARDALYLVLIGIGLFVCTWFFTYIWGWTGEVNAKRIRERYLQAVLRQEIAFFDNVGAGEVATRIQTDTNLVQQGTSEKVPLVIQFASSFITGFVLAYIRSWRLALALSSIFPCMSLTGAIMAKFSAEWVKLSLSYIATSGSLAEEVISTIRTAHSLGAQKTLSSRYEGHIRKSQEVDMKIAILNGVGIGVFFFTIYASYALAFYFGTTLIISGRADLGTVVSVFMAILIGSFSLVVIAPQMQGITQAIGAASKLFETIERSSRIDSSKEEGLRPEDGEVRGEVEFKGVGFVYPSRPDVKIFENLSLKFEAGKTTALVGASGSGKSSIVSLLLRFYDPTSFLSPSPSDAGVNAEEKVGMITLDGYDLKTLNLKFLRSQIGYVSQEPVLFSTSILENVSHGLIGTRFENLPKEEKEKMVKEACEIANANGFVEKLPDGYMTRVGEKGLLLSGGQKQRIAIARAIISNPPLLLLDEATSALDTASESIVQSALERASKGRTTVVIAHRLSTVKNADRIYILGAKKGDVDGDESGRGSEVIESGTHEELVTRKEGVYRGLIQAQALREIEDDKITSRVEAGIHFTETKVRIAEEDAEVTNKLGKVETPKPNRFAKDASPKSHSPFYLLKRLAAINRSSYPLYILAFIAAILTGADYPAYGLVFGIAIAVYQVPPNDPSSRHVIRAGGDRNALWYFIIALAASAVYSAQNCLFGRTAAELSNKLRTLGFRSIVRQDVEFFDQEKNNAGALTTSLSDNAQKVNGLAGITLGAIIQSFGTIVIGIIIGFVYAPKLAAVGIACIPFILSSGYIRLLFVLPKDRANKKAHEESAQIACEAVGAIRTVVSLTREEDCLRLYSESLEIPLRRALVTNFWSTGFFALSQSLGFGAIALVFWYGSRLVSTFEYSTKQFFVALETVTFGAIQAGFLFTYVPDISAAITAASDFITLLDSRPSIDATSTSGRVPTSSQTAGELALRNIYFTYPTRPSVSVLQGLDLTAKPGTYIALVGESGCGKSTVIQLIERFYDPTKGSVLLDGVDVREFNVAEYRKLIALVSQEPTLYAGTIRFNILLGAIKPEEEVTQSEIEAACRNANILDFINSLPNGFETEVGGKGAQLSGGQKQRIAIARALLRDPKVLLLDEATSALDSHSEKAVQEALDQAAQGRTTIAIAQRLSSIQNADIIYFLKDGRIYECGTHDELISTKGAYYEYTRLQQLSNRH